ncbi:uncharacterized protein LOC103524152 [Diaphorina citri]|nr:uncharacterized protein LOC103524152 [Diaphorina citri]
MTEKLQNDLLAQNTDTIQNINDAVEQRKAILSLLRNNIESQKNNIFEKREIILNKIEKSIEEAENVRNETGFQFIKPHKNISIDETDYKSTIWGTLLNEKMHPKHEAILTKKYCAQLVKVLQLLLKEDKMKIISKAQCLAQDIETQMKNDLRSEIQKGLVKYVNARQEWIKIQNILKDIDRIRQEIIEEKFASQGPVECKVKQNYLEACAQVVSLKCKLECMSRRNEDLFNQIKIIHGKIHHVAAQNIACQDQLNSEYEQLKYCINEKLKEIKEQEFSIAKFREYNKNKTQ